MSIIIDPSAYHRRKIVVRWDGERSWEYMIYVYDPITGRETGMQDTFIKGMNGEVQLALLKRFGLCREDMSFGQLANTSPTKLTELASLPAISEVTFNYDDGKRGKVSWCVDSDLHGRWVSHEFDEESSTWVRPHSIDALAQQHIPQDTFLDRAGYRALIDKFEFDDEVFPSELVRLTPKHLYALRDDNVYFMFGLSTVSGALERLRGNIKERDLQKRNAEELPERFWAKPTVTRIRYSNEREIIRISFEHLGKDFGRSYELDWIYGEIPLHPWTKQKWHQRYKSTHFDRDPDPCSPGPHWRISGGKPDYTASRKILEAYGIKPTEDLLQRASSLSPEELEKLSVNTRFAGFFEIEKYLPFVTGSDTEQRRQIEFGRKIFKRFHDRLSPESTELLVPDRMCLENLIEARVDPLLAPYSLHTTLISEERAKRPKKKIPERRASDPKDCILCPEKMLTVTPMDRIVHNIRGVEIYSIANLFPFYIPHYVTILSTEHKTDIVDLTEREFINFLMTGREYARQLRLQGYKAMWDFVNFGPSAGASQDHIHAQRGYQSNIFMKKSRKESIACEARYKEIGKDPFEVYMDMVRGTPLLIFENDDVFVFAPYAPLFTDQVDIFIKNNGSIIHNYIELPDQKIDSIAQAMGSVLYALRNERGVLDFNLITHQDLFDANGVYRMHWHIFPRTSAIAGSELEDVYVVSAYPRDTASAIKNNIFGMDWTNGEGTYRIEPIIQR